MRRYIYRLVFHRLFYVVIQLWGVVTLMFFLVHLIPGNPAQAFAGVGASRETIQAIERQFGFDEPLPVQYATYLNNVVHGELGDSLFTGQPVLSDLKQRLPATLELVTLSLLIAVAIGIPLGLYVALHREGIASKIVYVYGMLTGALPDFWLGLLLIYIFFFALRVVPAPLGRFDVLTTPPDRYTGFYTIDSLISGDISALGTALLHLVLPVATLVLVYTGNVVKMMRSSMSEAMQSEFVEYARASGLPERVVLRYAMRNALAPVVTVIAFTYGFLLGGAVLVETIFSWGGLGQYAVQSVVNSDYAAINGFVLVAALFMATVYLILDIVYAILDPRMTS